VILKNIRVCKLNWTKVLFPYGKLGLYVDASPFDSEMKDTDYGGIKKNIYQVDDDIHKICIKWDWMLHL